MAGHRRSIADDRGVQPILFVAGVILVTLVSMATVYSWTAVFTADEDRPAAPAMQAQAQEVGGQEPWIELLARGDRSIQASELDVHVVGPDGGDSSTVCPTPSLEPAGDCAIALDTEETFSRAQTLWLPCQGEGSHIVTVRVRGNLVLDTSVECSSATLG